MITPLFWILDGTRTSTRIASQYPFNISQKESFLVEAIKCWSNPRASPGTPRNPQVTVQTLRCMWALHRSGLDKKPHLTDTFQMEAGSQQEYHENGSFGFVIPRGKLDIWSYLRRYMCVYIYICIYIHNMDRLGTGIHKKHYDIDPKMGDLNKTHGDLGVPT